jgi:hypothetical protein
VQAIIVDGISIVNPQLAPIIGDNAESIIASLEKPRAGCPTHSKVIASGKPRPSSSGVSIVHHMTPSSHVRLATVQVLAAAALTEVEGVLPKEAMAINRAMATRSPSATRTHNSPTI